MRILPIFVVWLLLAGCSHSVKSFDPIPRQNHFVLDRDTRIPGTAGLAAGRYTAVFQDDHFVYYQGTGPCLILDLETTPIRVVGGFGVPKDPTTHNPRTFYLHGDESEAILQIGGGPVVAALSKLEIGRIRLNPEDQLSAEYLKIIRIVYE